MPRPRSRAGAGSSASAVVLGLLAVDPTTRHLPIIVCTAFRQLLPAQVAHLQAQDYVLLEKPFNVAVLLAHVHAMLRGPQARAVGG